MARFYLDQNVSVVTTRSLQVRGHDVLTARDEQSQRAKDDQHLLIAAEQDRILVSHDVADFVLLHGAWLRWSAAWNVAPRHAGILIIPQPPRLAPLGAASLVDRFVESGVDLSNRLFQWRPPGAWYESNAGLAWTRIV